MIFMVRKGSRMSEESRRKMSEKKKGRPSPWKGKSPSLETRSLMSQAKKGKVHTEEHRLKNRLGQIRRFKKTNPDYVMIGRNARIASNGGFHTQGEWETLKAQYNWTCLGCEVSEPNIKLTKDHIVPLLRGGTDNIENIQPLCQPCNSKKGTKITNNITP